MSETHLKTASLGASSDLGELPEAVTVLLAAHPRSPVRALRSTLETDGFELVSQASDSRSAVREALAHEPQVCLVDAELPGGINGAITAVVAHLPETRIGVLAESDDDDRTARAIRAGADGVLLVGAGPDAIRADLHLLAQGELSLPPQFASERLRDPSEPEPLAEGRHHSRIGSIVLYLPRFSKHLWRRLRSGMGPSVAWTSARDRMNEYW